ncbi:MAG TPA: hypothetical protein VJL39_03225 [Candidatus Paceibacterota bacterium]
MTERLKNSTEKIPENVHILDLPEARYRIIYETHEKHHTGESIGTPDALALELVSSSDYSDPEKIRDFLDNYWDSRMRKNPDHRITKEHLERYHIPMYLIDVSGPVRIIAPLLGGPLLLRAAEVGLGVAAIQQFAKVAKKVPALTRRDMLRGAIATALMAKGIPQAISVASNLNALASNENTQSSDAMKSVQRLNETISPETNGLPTTWRNAIWAQKLHAIADIVRTEIGRKPEIAVRVGVAHSGIEDMLRASPEERLQVVHRYMHIVKLVETDAEKVHISPMVRYEPATDGKWELTNVSKEPSLARIEM